MKMVSEKKSKQVRFEIVEADKEEGLGFDPSVGSKGGNAPCLFCNTVADGDYVKQQGIEKRMSQQMMAVACTRPSERGKVYLPADAIGDPSCYTPLALSERIGAIQDDAGVAELSESIENNPRSMDIDKAGFTQWADIFTGRQLLALMTTTSTILLDSGENRLFEIKS